MSKGQQLLSESTFSNKQNESSLSSNKWGRACVAHWATAEQLRSGYHSAGHPDTSSKGRPTTAGIASLMSMVAVFYEPQPARAQVTYSYTGNEIFQTVDPFAAEGNITGSLTFKNISAGYTGEAIGDSYTMNGGGYTLSGSYVTCNCTLAAYFVNGQMTQWYVVACPDTGACVPSIGTVNNTQGLLSVNLQVQSD